MLDFRLETFLALCKIGHYRKTAEHLHITQPAVTQHIHYLEEQYGGKLFEYKDRKPVLTSRGERLYRFVLTMSADSRHLKSLLRTDEVLTHPLAFGATLTIGEYVMAPVLAKVWEQYSAMPLTMLVDNTQVLLQKLRDSEIDFALLEGFFNRAEYDSQELCRAEFIGICAPDCSLAKRTVALEEILSQRLILREKGSGTREVFEQALWAQSLAVSSFRSVNEIGNMSAIKQLVSKGCGISFMYRAAAEIELAERILAPIKIADFCISHTFSFVYLKNSLHKKEYLQWFRFFRDQIAVNRHTEDHCCAGAL